MSANTAIRRERPASAEQVLEIVRALATELHPQTPVPASVTLDSRLERDFGLDSLSRVELIARLEHTFETSLPAHVMTSAETPRDLLRALSLARAIPVSTVVQAPPAPLSGDIIAPPAQAQTLLDVLDAHARKNPARPHICVLTESLQEEVITYEALRAGAARVAGGLQARGLAVGETVALMLPTSRDYFLAFFGVLMAGGVPVPIYPPLRAAQLEEHLRRHARILENAQSVLLITLPEARRVARLFRTLAPRLRASVTVEELSTANATPSPFAAQAQDIAFLQYTSGSTGHPKGVILTHANLLANLRAMGATVEATSKDVFVSWMPLYHDMGLIGAWFGSLYYAMPLVVMSPLVFLAHPREWLRAIHRHRGTLSGAPNFGYELCLRHVTDDDLKGLDLSSWRLAFNGAEAVSPDTVTRFAERFGVVGFRSETMFPVYGLAESSVGLAFPPLGRGPLIDRIERERFMHTGHAQPAGRDDPTALRYVACGRPLTGHEIRIVDAAGFEVAEHEEGRLEFKGPSATSGYYRSADETERLFHGDWLDSGDRAYMAQGEVYITGRVKDAIIRAGRNIYPDELEETVGNIPGVRKGCVAVFGSGDRATGTERLVVLAETRATDAPTHQRLHREINAALTDLIGGAPDEVVLAPPHTVLKTSSGKVRRAASREIYQQGRIGQQYPLWWQITRLLWAGLAPQWRRASHTIADLLYAAYAWALFWVFAPLTWSAVALIPRPELNRRLIRAVAKLFLLLTATRMQVRGLEQLPQDAHVLVANHSSYIDGIVLTAVLPPTYRFVAKREFLDQFISRTFLRHIGAEFVERFEARRSAEDARRLALAAQAGLSFVFFPEGTFSRQVGLLPFHMGAFLTAADAGLTVAPLAIRGTRSILRNGQWFPRRGTVRITIGAALQPEGRGWDAALKLRNAAREMILRDCGEPDGGAASPPAG